MRIREFESSDIHQIVSLFYETVHSVNAKDYSMEQLNAWAPKDEIDDNIEKWEASLTHNSTYIAERKDEIVGFSDMTHNGYLDRLFIHKDFQGQGIATTLVNMLESEARKLGLSEINTAASITAKPFFERCGFRIIKSQKVKRRGITLLNFQMVKPLVFE